MGPALELGRRVGLSAETTVRQLKTFGALHLKETNRRMGEWRRMNPNMPDDFLAKQISTIPWLPEKVKDAKQRIATVDYLNAQGISMDAIAGVRVSEVSTQGNGKTEIVYGIIPLPQPK